MATRISLVTTTLNAEAYLADCLASIGSQRYPDLEHIVIDAGSTDRTAEILEAHADQITEHRVVPGIGMYAGLKLGFSMTTGDVMGWINADDVLHPGALSLLDLLFAQNRQVNWVTGRPCLIDDENRAFAIPEHRYRSRHRFLAGDRRWIQQESTFWRRDLWERVGGLDEAFKYAGDFDLWFRFYQQDRLFLLDCLLGAFRVHRQGQLSRQHATEYQREVNQVYRHFRKAQSRSARAVSASLAMLDSLIRTRAHRHPGQCTAVLQALGLTETICFAPLLQFDPVRQVFHTRDRWM